LYRRDLANTAAVAAFALVVACAMQQECKKLNNYSSLATIFLSLQNTEMAGEWQKLTKKHIKLKEELDATTTSAKDFFQLRSAMTFAIAPTVPYLGMPILLTTISLSLVSESERERESERD
jgi:hypothetical protein